MWLVLERDSALSYKISR